MEVGDPSVDMDEPSGLGHGCSHAHADSASRVGVRIHV